MKTPIIVHINVQNPSDLAPYQQLAGATMKEHGIRLIKKTAQAPVLEGESPGTLTVLLEAESEEVAQQWYSSPGYKKAIEARDGIATFTTVVLT